MQFQFGYSFKLYDARITFHCICDRILLRQLHYSTYIWMHSSLSVHVFRFRFLLMRSQADLYKSIQTLKSIQIRFPNFELSWIESLHKNGIQELSWITYLLEMNWVWIELSLSTKRKNWIWFESSLTQKNLKELRVCKTWMRIHESTHCWLETFSLHHEISIESN